MNVQLVARELYTFIKAYPHSIDSKNKNAKTQHKHLLELANRVVNSDYKNESQANRWIGYIQGCLVCSGCATVVDMMTINKRC